MNFGAALPLSQVEIVEGFFDDLGRCRANALLLHLLRLALRQAALLRRVCEEERVLDERAGLRLEERAGLAHARQASNQLLEQVFVRDLNLEGLGWEVGAAAGGLAGHWLPLRQCAEGICRGEEV